MNYITTKQLEGMGVDWKEYYIINKLQTMEELIAYHKETQKILKESHLKGGVFNEWVKKQKPYKENKL